MKQVLLYRGNLREGQKLKVAKVSTEELRNGDTAKVILSQQKDLEQSH